MKIKILTLFLFYAAAVHSQNPLVKMWDYRFGGTYPDALTCFNQTADGGFILAGYSNSGANGDKTQPTYGDYDYWIVKLDQYGVKQWDADFGGTDFDYLTAIKQTADGGYIMGGYSLSNTGGLKTQDNWDATGQTNDIWIVKCDANGLFQWEKSFGGTEEDRLLSLDQTADGGYIFGGYSNSPAGGDKTQNIQGGNDFWVIRTDANGNKLWDKDYGGILIDNLRALRQTPDHGFILGGLSNSPASGDKTHPTFGVYDFWLVKIDSIGNFLWDKEYGGTDDEYLWTLEITNDSGFIFAGITSSGWTGNKTTPLWGGTGMDYWAVRTDSIGNILWQRDLGGTDNEDEIGNVSVGGDGGFVFGGTTYSPVSGDKTETNLGSEQGWFVKVDSLGITVLDKTIALNSHDENGYAIQTKEGCYAFAHFNGAAPGGLKTQPVQGVYDYWIVRFCDSTMVPVSAFASVDPICPGTCTQFTNLSLNATSFIWNFPGGTPSMSTDVNPSSICYNSPGIYDVTLIATSAISTDTLTLHNFVTVYPYPLPQGIMQVGDTLFANQGAVSYQWYFNGSLIPGATDYYFVSILNGDYNVVATDINGCEVEAVIFNVTEVKSGDQVNEVVVTPDGDAEHFLIRYKGNVQSIIQIYNAMGELVMKLPSKVNGMQEVAVDASGISPGIYFISISTGEKTIFSKFIR